MSRKFLVPIDLSNLSLLNALLHPSAVAPVSPSAGQAWYDTGTSTLKVYSGTAWNPVGNMGTGTEAAKGTSSAAGALYFATDSKLLYVGNGSGGWTQSNAFGTVANLATTASDGTSTDYARADHQHRQAAADHSAIPLSALSAATADVSLGGFKITNVATPTLDTDATNKLYVDSVAQGLDVKSSVRAATTVNITLSGLQTVDGVSLVAGDRVIVKNQSAPAENGIYSVSATTWTRTADANTWNELISAFAFVEEGTVNGDCGWVCTVDAGGTLGTTSVTWEQFSGAGQITAGDGLTKTGNTLNVVTASSARIVVNPDSIDLASVARTDTAGTAGITFVQSVNTDSYGRLTGVVNATVAAARIYAQTIGDGSATSIAVTHSLGSQDVIVQVRDAVTNLQVECDVTATNNNVVTVAFAVAPALNSLRVTVTG